MILEFLKAFLVGGLICAAAQVLIDKTGMTPARILSGCVVLGVLLSAAGLYAPFAEWAGAGATVPLPSTLFSWRCCSNRGKKGKGKGPLPFSLFAHIISTKETISWTSRAYITLIC